MKMWLRIGVVFLALAITVLMQVYASRKKSTRLGLVLPTLFFLLACLVMGQSLQQVDVHAVERAEILKALSYFSVYNIPTIIFLCIYNYFQSIRLHR